MLIRALFWFSLAIMFLPIGNSENNDKDGNVSGEQTVLLFQSLASDFSDFCARQPDACVTAKGLARQFGARLHSFADSFGTYLAQAGAEQTDPVTTSSVKSGPDKQSLKNLSQ